MSAGAPVVAAPGLVVAAAGLVVPLAWLVGAVVPVGADGLTITSSASGSSLWSRSVSAVVKTMAAAARSTPATTAAGGPRRAGFAPTVAGNSVAGDRSAGPPRGAASNHQLRVGVDAHRHAELLADQLRHQRDARRTADEEHGAQLLGGRARPARAICWTSSIVWPMLGRIIASNSVRVIRTVDVCPGSMHRDVAAASRDSASFASTQRRRSWAIAAADPPGAREHRRARRPGLAPRRAGTPPRRSRCRRGARCRPARSDVLEASPVAPQQGDVERAAAEVVDEHRRSGSTCGDGGVVDAPRPSGSEISSASPRPTSRERVAQHAELVLGPVRRMGDHDARGRSPICSVTVSTTQRANRAVSRSAWYGDPDSMIGTGSPSRRLNSRAMPAGLVAPRRSRRRAEQRLVAVGEHHRRHGDPVGLEADDLGTTVPRQSGRGIGRAHVNTQNEWHESNPRISRRSESSDTTAPNPSTRGTIRHSPVVPTSRSTRENGAR